MTKIDPRVIDPCPFCGWATWDPPRGTEEVGPVMRTTGKGAYVACRNCGARGPTRDTPQSALEGWLEASRWMDIEDPHGDAEYEVDPTAELKCRRFADFQLRTVIALFARRGIPITTPTEAIAASTWLRGLATRPEDGFLRAFREVLDEFAAFVHGDDDDDDDDGGDGGEDLDLPRNDEPLEDDEPFEDDELDAPIDTPAPEAPQPSTH